MSKKYPIISSPAGSLEVVFNEKKICGVIFLPPHHKTPTSKGGMKWISDKSSFEKHHLMGRCGGLPQKKSFMKKRGYHPVSDRNLMKFMSWFDNYNQKSKEPFPLKYLDLTKGTVFQQAVWRQLLKIPFGETRSYGWIAKKMGLKGGAQAVGQANKKNPFPILIPCHRVIAADGSIGGYSSGIRIKKKLLKHEGILLPVVHPTVKIKLSQY